LDGQLKKTLLKVARFYDQNKVGDGGPLGFRRSSDMMTLMACLEHLMDKKIIDPDTTNFLDLGCWTRIYCEKAPSLVIMR
jgi:hypothetical protein